MSCMALVCWGSARKHQRCADLPWRENVDRHYGRVLEARGHNVTVIDPVEKLLAWGITSNLPSILLSPPAVLRQSYSG